jgi:predicted phosphodiesterase
VFGPVIAAIYDVHGNLPALEAVLDDAERAGATRYWLGGDYALFGGWPAETLRRLKALDAEATIRGNADVEVMIRGNVDRWASDPAAAPDDDFLQAAIADCRAAIGDEQAGALGDLPAEDVRDGWHIVHASPGSDMDGLLPRPRDDEDRILAGAKARRLLVGHTHMAFRRESAGGIEIVNPGSVGIPLDGDHRASYALLHPDGRVEHRRVEHDWRAAIERLHEVFPDASWTGEIAGRIERARMG